MTSSDSIEATATTVDDAISQALDQLGAHGDDVTIEVLSTPRAGVLGLGARPARVRVTRHTPAMARSAVQSPPPAAPLKRTAPELLRPAMPPAEKRLPENRPAPRPESRTPAISPAASASAEPSSSRANPAPVPIAASEARSQARPRGDARSEPDQRPRQEPSNEGRGREARPEGRRDDRPRRDRERPQRAAGDSRENKPSANFDESPREDVRADNPPRRRPERTRRAESAPASQANPDSDLDMFSDDGSGEDQRDLVAPEEQVTEAIKIAGEILEMMGEKATIETVRDEGLQSVELNIRGDGSGILIGRHGQTLDALEYIVNRILGRRIKDALAISIDTESYRARRRGQLHRMALSKGEQAKREHVTVQLDPMPPRDRRIVHLALKDDPLITTRSFGEGFLRSIEIVPVDGSGDRDRNDRGGRDRRGRTNDSPHESEDDDLPLGQQGGFKHGQKRIV